MKKHTKKLMSFLVTLVMVLSMTATVFAAPVDTTISVGNGDNRTYDVYQIFTGDLSGDVLSNVKWGLNGTGTEGQAVPQDTLNALQAVKDAETETEKLEVIKQYVNLESTAFGTVSKDNDLTAPTGYYLFKDVTTPVAGQAYSLYVVEIVGPTTFNPKKGEVESFKKVDDKNDSTGSENDVVWQDSADYDMGDMVPFQLTGTVPADYEHYNAYFYSFHDVESQGLTFDPESVVVKVDDTVISSGYEVVTSGLEEGETFEVKFQNLKAINEVEAGSEITVEYESELNTNAVIGALGNPNDMYLQYSNNPNSEWTPSWGTDEDDNDNDGQTDEEDEKEGPTGKTTLDRVIVFTYKVEVNKVDQDLQPLQGAEFTLAKKLADGSTTNIAVVMGEDLATFTAVGLDDGDYVLTESVTPAGYNTIAPVEFTISATHEEEAAEPKLLTLEGNAANGNLIEGSIETLTLKTTVVNQAGTTLPETGGVGTTLIYVIGAVLVLGAGVVLVTKKRAA